MAKIFQTIIVVLLIALVATFIVSAVSLQSKTDKILTTYAARREELAARQLQIQDMIVALNSTMQTEAVNQQALATELGVKINNTVVAPPVVVPTTPVVSTPVQQTPPPVVTQPIRRVTRAS